MNKAGTVAALTGLLVLSGCVQPAIRDLPGPDLPETAANSPQAGLKKRPLSDEQLFIGCAGCHSLAADAAHKTGPNLYGISGQAAAKQPGFSYSKALQEAAESWLQWDEETLSIFIQQTEQMVPGTWMLYYNTLDEAETHRLAAYILKQNANKNK